MRNVLILLSLLFSTSVVAKVKLNNLKFNSNTAAEGKVNISFKAPLRTTPELSVKGNMIQVEIPGSVVWPKVEKRVTINKKFDTTLMAYQYNKEKVRFRIMLPYDVKGLENRISLTLNNDSIDLFFPKKKSKLVTKKAAPKKKAAWSYDESYLDKLIKDNKLTQPDKITATKTTAPIQKTAAKEKTDKVKMTLSSVAKKEDAKKFSISSYVGKFLAFFGVILLLFYGAITLMKKGVIKKGKLGFLNSNSLVEVMSSTYVGPKKSLLVVRAHNQVFLVGTSEKGMHYLSELNDVPGIMKTGEKSVFGDNFETNLDSEKNTDKEFKLKEVATESGESVAALIAGNDTEDKVRFSDQIKSKMKSLKQFQ